MEKLLSTSSAGGGGVPLPETVHGFSAGTDAPFRIAVRDVCQHLRQELIGYKIPEQNPGRIARIRKRFLQMSVLTLKNAIDAYEEGAIGREALLLTLQTLTVERQHLPTILREREAAALRDISRFDFTKPEVSGRINSKDAMQAWYSKVDAVSAAVVDHGRRPADEANHKQHAWDTLKTMKRNILAEGKSEYVTVPVYVLMDLIDHAMKQVEAADNTDEAVKAAVAGVFQHLSRPREHLTWQTNHVTQGLSEIIGSQVKESLFGSEWWGSGSWHSALSEINQNK